MDRNGTNHLYRTRGGSRRTPVGRYGASPWLYLDGQHPGRTGRVSDCAFEAADQPMPVLRGTAGAGLGDPGDHQLLQGPEKIRLAPAACPSGGGILPCRCLRAAVFVPPEGESPVLQAVQSLPEKYRRAIYLRYYEEYTVEEIAGVMGCRPSQVSTYLYRGKAKLRTALGGSYERACLSE